MRDLTKIREEIDDIDSRIVELYEKRMALAADVAEYKIGVGKPVYDGKREEEKLSALAALASCEFTRNGVRELFEQIMSMSRKKQYQILEGKRCGEQPEFAVADGLDGKDAGIVFQGVEGAYSQQATKAFFGKDCRSFHVETWKDAMEAIRKREADYAVLPLENSSAGIVPENYDLLVEYDNYIVGEQIIPIDHALLALPGSDISDISCVYSHPQALMQCSSYLDEHRQWEKVSVKNTALAAKKVKEEGLSSQAAIASEITADIYGLAVLERMVQNNKNNSTRFVIVAGQKICLREASHVCICFETVHRSGSLYHMLSHLIYNGINMTNIQSRPIPGRTWEYRFFVDFEGRLLDHAVRNALRGLKEETTNFRILGTYQ